MISYETPVSKLRDGGDSVGNHFFQTETITRQDEKELAMFGE